MLCLCMALCSFLYATPSVLYLHIGILDIINEARISVLELMSFSSMFCPPGK
ncbi:hypothetical protein BDV40DRAFT_266149 [Aspergillus tamarii]|uniref:Uncharacterized protein n=1 Tax=Aspergillus tamarii TaxID=41984 RepID=A0A5N6UTQ0_ASPTM|nr:hypothetical protein BDV40DRAFT_266149 [Aspergillus tamarii]